MQQSNTTKKKKTAQVKGKERKYPQMLTVSGVSGHPFNVKLVPPWFEPIKLRNSQSQDTNSCID